MYQLVTVVCSVNVFDNGEHLHQWYSISDIMVPTSLKLTIERILQDEEQILERVEKDPAISTRRLAAEVEVSQILVHHTLKGQDLHPHHVQKVQALEYADFPCPVVTAMSCTP